MSPLYQMSHSAQNLNRNVRQNNWVRSEREESKAAGIFLSSAPLPSRAQRADGAHYFFPAAFCSLFLFPPPYIGGFHWSGGGGWGGINIKTS